jgi:hypothetical protein
MHTGDGGRAARLCGPSGAARAGCVAGVGSPVRCVVRLACVVGAVGAGPVQVHLERPGPRLHWPRRPCAARHQHAAPSRPGRITTLTCPRKHARARAAASASNPPGEERA